MSTRVGDSAYAPLTDGTAIEIRPARPGDFDAVRGVKALAVISSGLDRPGRAELLGICRGRAKPSPLLARFKTSPTRSAW